MAGSECNEYHRRRIHLAQARLRSSRPTLCAPPSHPLSPRESRRRRRTRSTKTSRVSGAGSTDNRTVLQSAGELACRAFARPLTVPISFSLFLSPRFSFLPSSALRCIIRRVPRTSAGRFASIPSSRTLTSRSVFRFARRGGFVAPARRKSLSLRGLF
ncbi:hypothetical protein PUN28_000194 [Cardiocondyla obscurior]|uniref:Uncharacterized protein n=1 Tax=Cardiocondyla obscurior TaxID=286306 RepID=A0AAW2GY50_9HYME